MPTYYKFLNSDGTTPQQGFRWPAPGEWLPRIDGALVVCENGYHLMRETDVVYWCDAEELWEVEVEDGAEVLESDNKIVVLTARRVRRVDNWNARTARLFACDCAEQALMIAGNPDPRSVEAVRVARLYAIGEATNEQLSAASAAWAAAWAAWAARDAAMDASAAAWAASAAARAAWAAARAAWAARDAAMDAAWAAWAARDAAWAARDAARAARDASAAAMDASAAAGAASAAARDARDAARQWQTKRLWQYLRGEM